jgi:MFS family permease
MNTANSNAPSEKNRATANRYNLVIGIFLATVNVGFVVTSFGIFFKPVSDDFGWTRAVTSGAFSLCTIMSGLFGILAGRLADRFSPRILIVICGILQSGSYLLLSQMTSVWQLYFYYGILTGAGMANIVPASTLVTKWFKRQRGKMTGLALSGAAFSSIFAPYLAAWLIDRYKWQTSYAVIGWLCLAVLVVAIFFMFRSGKEELPPEEKLTGGESQNSMDNWSLLKIFRSWTFWCLAIIYFCFHFALSVVQVHVVPHATDLGISSILAASVLAIANGANVVGSFILGSINDRIGSHKSLLVGLAILVAGSLLLLLSNSFWMLALFAIIFGFAWGGVGSLRSVIVANLFGLRSNGVLVATLFFVGLIGGTLSPVISGYIFDVSGQYRLAFLLTLGLSIVALLFSFFFFRGSRKEL